MTDPAAPIGVFDSGVGGLSVLRELRRLLPDEDFLYYADSAHCPYGGKSLVEIQARAAAITEELLAAACKLIVVACNTATIAAVEHLRANYPVPFVGMEPAVKPACALTRSGVVGVLATGAALGGEKFHRLVAQHAAGVRVITQPCPGLVECVEAGELDGPRVAELIGRYVKPLTRAGADVIVLGCTHYPFLRELVQNAAGPKVTLLDTGEAVARQTRRVLERDALLRAAGGSVGRLEWRTSADRGELRPVVERLTA
ncbi:MAG: glutamate racemase [Panacagrimonas sp.]|jgi:glutamate racemase|nr:glutamate racemase [Panacagrimonas sp.]MCC2655965.1 glutamate racemase [Panacagrimonas sp.]